MASCFICLKPAQISSVQNNCLKKSLVTTSKLLNIFPCCELEWMFLDTFANAICCSNCTERLKTIQETFDLLQITEKKLNECLEGVKTLVKKSSGSEPQDATYWAPSCFKFRSELSPRADYREEQNSEANERKIPSTEFQHKLRGPEDGDGVNNWENDWATTSQYSDGEENEDQVHKSKKRKIVVYADEDSRLQYEQGNADLPFPRETSHQSNTMCTDYLINVEPQTDPGSYQSSTPPPPDPRVLYKGGPGTMKGKEEGPGRNVPFQFVTDNLFFYKQTIFVEFNFTHLICKASNCSFQVPFTYYSSFQEMRKHLEDNHRGKKYRKQRPLYCLLCNPTPKSLIGHLELHNHMKSVHPELANTQGSKGVCECCLRTMSYFRVMEHEFSHKNEEELDTARRLGIGPASVRKNKPDKPPEQKPKCFRFKCPEEGCDYATNFSTNWKRHTNAHKPMGERTDLRICPDCGQGLTTNKSLQNHIRRVHRPDFVNVIHCPVCDKKFMKEDRRALAIHLKRHRGETPFVCDECGKAFVTQPELNAHLKYTHSKDFWPCAQCDKGYTNLSSYRRHWFDAHNESLFPEASSSTSRQKRLPSSLATRFYTERADMKKARELIPKRKWPCDQCDVVCGYKHVLRRHVMRIHQGIDVHAKWRKKKVDLKHLS